MVYCVRPRKRYAIGLVTLFAAAVLTMQPGCQVEITDGVGVLDPEGRDLVPGNDEVLVRFVNLSTDEAVEVQFHGSNAALGTLPDDLFAAENLVTRGIGLAGSGILAPRTADQILFPCTTELVIGTLGGSFVDAQTGDARGEGQVRWAEDSPLGLCGSYVTFEYAPEGNEFVTRLRIGS